MNTQPLRILSMDRSWCLKLTLVIMTGAGGQIARSIIEWLFADGLLRRDPCELTIPNSSISIKDFTRSKSIPWLNQLYRRYGKRSEQNLTNCVPQLMYAPQG